MAIKRCNCCKLFLAATEFYSRSKKKKALKTTCKKCTITRTLAWSKANADHVREWRRAYDKRPEVRERRNDRYRIKQAMKKRAVCAA